MTADSPDIRELYETYGRSVYRRCQYLLRNDDDAHDALHEVFIKVVERYHSFRGESSPLTWLVRIATNHCLNLLRARRAGWRDRFQQTVSAGEATRDTEAAHFERAELVYGILKKLDRPVQLAAVHYFVDEMSQQEAAEAVGCSVPTLRKHLRRFITVARKQLQAIDADLVFGEPPV